MKGDMNMKGILRRAGVPNEHWVLGRSLDMNIKGIPLGAGAPNKLWMLGSIQHRGDSERERKREREKDKTISISVIFSNLLNDRFRVVNSGAGAAGWLLQPRQVRDDRDRRRAQGLHRWALLDLRKSSNQILARKLRANGICPCYCKIHKIVIDKQNHS